MIKSKNGILIALCTPILVLLILTFYKKYILTVGQPVTLQITGYDPRDLLSGHYLIYRVDYGVKYKCDYRRYSVNQKANKRLERLSNYPAYMCLENKTFTRRFPHECGLLIKGRCERGQFKAGIERFYIPESDAPRLDKLVRAKKASIVLSVMRDGRAQIKDLLIEGKSWKAD